MRVRVGHRLGRNSWVSVGVPVGRWTGAFINSKPPAKAYKHSDREMRNACKARYKGRPGMSRHDSEFDRACCEMETKHGELGREMMMAEVGSEHRARARELRKEAARLREVTERHSEERRAEAERLQAEAGQHSVAAFVEKYGH